jgi:hypothetical protein
MGKGHIRQCIRERDIKQCIRVMGSVGAELRGNLNIRVSSGIETRLRGSVGASWIGVRGQFHGQESGIASSGSIFSLCSLSFAFLRHVEIYFVAPKTRQT